jgi:DNA-binding LacI/PurR family transcriptional regulator
MIDTMTNNNVKNIKTITRGVVRLKDIAEKVGVSITVVSKALHNTKAHVRMSKTTLDRIRKVAAQMGYRPSAAGRMLVKKQTDVIGVITSYSSDAERVPRLDYVAELMTPACQILWEHHKNLMVLNLPLDSRTTGRDILPSMVGERRVDGVLVMEPSSNPVLCGELDKIGFPWVGVCAKQPEIMRPYNQVITETPAVTEIPVRYLVQKGHRCLCYLHNDIPYGQETCRHEGISRVLAEFPSVAVIRIPYRGPSTDTNERRDISNMLQEKLFPGKRSSLWPTAVFCDHVWMAVAVYDAAAQKRLSIPRDLSVAGYGNDHIVEMLDPPLSSVMLESYDSTGVYMLLRLIETGKNQPNIECKPKYVQRESVGPVRPSHVISQ